MSDAELISAYVDQVYWDLFLRDVDPSGLATWTGLLLGGTPRRAVADAITRSDEFRVGLIRHAYNSYLGREPDAAGMAHWLQKMRQGMTIQQLGAQFLGSLEYYASVGGDEVFFVHALYQDVLGRTPSSDEVSHWWYALQTIQLGASRVAKYGISRYEVALGFLMSTERLSMDLDDDYQWLLVRGLDPSGKRTWVTQIQTGTRYEAVIGSIIASEEYLSLITRP